VYIIDASGERHERPVTWATPPAFYLHEVNDGFATVSAVDFNTYVVIRDLLTVKYEGPVVSRPETVVRMRYVSGNTDALIAIPVAELSGI
jgi:hypothetical protein